MEKFMENVLSAEKIIMAADHMLYVTFPLIKDKRILLKILQETKNAITLCINSILQYEYFHKRITLYKDPRQNFNSFIDKCAESYGVGKEQVNLVLELFDFIEKHKDSSFEFMRGEKIVVLSNGSKMRTMTVERAKEFLIIAKGMLRKTRETIGQSK